MASFDLRGDREMRRKLEALEKAFPRRVAGALRQEAEVIMTRSKRDFVPVDLGTLRSSGHVEDPKIGVDGTISVTLAYGSAAAPYALIQHENPDFRHTVGTWKYLEKPLRAAKGGMEARLARRLKL